MNRVLRVLLIILWFEMDEFLGTKLFSKPLSFASASALASVSARLRQWHRGAGYFFGLWPDPSAT
jgi:hypothetical protein